MKGAAILIHYRTPELVPRALEALIADAASSGLDMEYLLVDNGSGPADRALWQDLPLRVLEPRRNLGYAGGLNYGVEHTEAEWWVVLNPDVFVRPGCLRALHEALSHGADVAGPRFFWDERCTWNLPPTERRRRLDECLAVTAALGGAWASRARARWRRHAHHHWTATETTESFELSGALLAIRREAWDAFGPFDDRYPLYFEETDYLERLRLSGGRAVFVPQAEAIHLHARSTVAEPRSEEWFAQSARRFRQRHYGRLFNALLEQAGALLPGPVRAAGMSAAWSAEHLAQTAWIEVSAAPAGFPAAGALASGVDLAWLDQETAWLRSRLPGAPFTVRLIDRSGAELQACQIEPGEAG